jgi:hypothetical protein
VSRSKRPTRPVFLFRRTTIGQTPVLVLARYGGLSLLSHKRRFKETV